MKNDFTRQLGKEHAGSWLEICKFGYQCNWTGLETCEYIECGYVYWRGQTIRLLFAEFCALLCSFRQTVCWHQLHSGPCYKFCQTIHLWQCPTNHLAPDVTHLVLVWTASIDGGTCSAFAISCCLCQRGCSMANRIRKCCSYQLNIVLLVPCRRVTYSLQSLYIVR